MVKLQSAKNYDSLEETCTCKSQKQLQAVQKRAKRKLSCKQCRNVQSAKTSARSEETCKVQKQPQAVQKRAVEKRQNKCTGMLHTYIKTFISYSLFRNTPTWVNFCILNTILYIFTKNHKQIYLFTGKHFILYTLGHLTFLVSRFFLDF